MTTHPLQLHLFDAHSDVATIPPMHRRRLLSLTGELLQEAARSETPPEEAPSVTETVDE